MWTRPLPARFLIVIFRGSLVGHLDKECGCVGEPLGDDPTYHGDNVVVLCRFLKL